MNWRRRRLLDTFQQQSSLDSTRKQLLLESSLAVKKGAVTQGRPCPMSILSTPPSAAQCVHWALERVESQTVSELEADVLLDVDTNNDRRHRLVKVGTSKSGDSQWRDTARAVVDEDLDIDVV